MEFKVVMEKGEYKDYPYGYRVLLDERVVWEDDFSEEYTDEEIFKMMLDDIWNGDEIIGTYRRIKDILDQRTNE